MFENLFADRITRKTEHKNRVEGQIEVLKKQQKVKSESICHEYDFKKSSTIDSINAQINSLKAQILSLETNKECKIKMLEEEMKVELDKIMNNFNQKIISKQNKVRRLSRFIEAERQNMEDVAHYNQPNAPQQNQLQPQLEKPTIVKGFKQNKKQNKTKTSKKSK